MKRQLAQRPRLHGTRRGGIAGAVASRLEGCAESGQALVLLVAAMVVVLGFGAMTIDLATWYQKHHQAQVAADAASLAAANCLASAGPGQTCTSPTDYAAATTEAVTTAFRNGVTIPDSSVDVTTDANGTPTVSVTAPDRGRSFFATAFGLGTQTETAGAAAAERASISFMCASSGDSSCLSLFAGNTTCPGSGSTTVGLSLVTEDSGGGHASIPKAFTNGYLYNGSHSGAENFDITTPGTGGSPYCSTDAYETKNTSVATVPHTLPYPAVWTQPVCDAAHTSTYWTTDSDPGHQITTPGTYCVSSPAAPACTKSASGMTSGYIYVDESSMSLTSGGAYEFVSPCTTVAAARSAAITPIAGQPLVYGTANITTKATTSTLPTCAEAANNGTAGSDTFFTGNGAYVGAPVYDQCGTVEMTKNNDFVGYVESWNIVVDKNNLQAGDGPTSPAGAGETVSADSLVN